MPFHERIYAEVTDNADPEKRRRLKVRCPALVREDAELPFWIEPLSLGRVFDVPALEDRVELLIIAGRADDQEMARLDQNSMRWSPAFQDEATIPAEILDNYTDYSAIWADNGSFVAVNKSTGAILLVKPDGSRVDIKADNVIELLHKDGDKVKLDGTNISVEGDTLIGGASAVYFIVRGDKLLTFMNQDKVWKDTHMHPTAALGPPSPPVVPSPVIPTDLNSTKHKVE